MAALLCCAASSCSSYRPAESAIPTFRVDELASEVIAKGPGAGDNVTATVRTQIANALAEMMEDRPDLIKAKPARFKAEVNYDLSYWPMAACLGVLYLFGCPMTTTEVTLELTLEVDGKSYRGKGSNSAAGGIYYNGDGSSTTAGAVEQAMREALGEVEQAMGREQRGGLL